MEVQLHSFFKSTLSEEMYDHIKSLKCWLLWCWLVMFIRPEFRNIKLYNFASNIPYPLALTQKNFVDATFPLNTQVFMYCLKTVHPGLWKLLTLLWQWTGFPRESRESNRIRRLSWTWTFCSPYQFPSERSPCPSPHPDWLKYLLLVT